MFRQSLAKSTSLLQGALANQTRSYAKATIVGRLGNAPQERQTSDGRTYYIYALAVNRPPKKNQDGTLQTSPEGYPIRDTDWFSVFNFRENSSAGMQSLAAGDLVLVETLMQSRKVGDGPETETILRELSHRVLDKSARREE